MDQSINLKKISVVIPMYHSERTIADALNSVFNQQYDGNFEIIIVNDGSTDNSQEVVEDLIKQNDRKNVSITLISQQNQGVSYARNKGMKSASGEYIALLDSDDEWNPDKISKQMALFQKYPYIDFLGSAKNNEPLWILWKKIDSLHKIVVKELLIKMYPQTSTWIFKRELFMKYHGYNETMRHAEDGEFLLRYCAQANCYYIPESLVMTGHGKPNFGHSGLSGNLKAMHQGVLRMFFEAKKNKLIGFWVYRFACIYERLKYLRRVVIVSNRRR